MKETIVITGSHGYIGYHLNTYLGEKYKIIYVDKKIGKEAKNISQYAREKVKCVIHLAAQTSVFNTNTNMVIEDNITQFAKVVDFCNKYGYKLIYASSSTANNITSVYGMSKKFNEDFAKVYCENSTGIRFHNVYSHKPRINTLLGSLLHFKNPLLYNNGENVRCFTHINNILECIEYCINENTPKLLNCVNKEPIKVIDFATEAKRLFDIDFTLTNEKRMYDAEVQEVDDSVKLFDTNYIGYIEGLRLSREKDRKLFAECTNKKGYEFK